MVNKSLQALTRVIIPVGYGEYKVDLNYYSSGEASFAIMCEESGLSLVLQFPDYQSASDFVRLLVEWAKCQTQAECEFMLLQQITKGAGAKLLYEEG